MAYPGADSGLAYSSYGQASPRIDPVGQGSRRKKLAGYLKAANEIRQSYFSAEGDSGRNGGHDSGADGSGAFPDAAVVRSGNEEMILFPSYARKHVKSKVRIISRLHTVTWRDF